MNVRTLLPCLSIPAAALISSCANSSHVLVYQHSNFGLNAGSNPATQSTHVRLGMRREFIIITPKVENEKFGQEGEPQYKAASSYVASRFRVRDPFTAPEVAEIVSTGTAATLIGESQGSEGFLSKTESSNQ